MKTIYSLRIREDFAEVARFADGTLRYRYGNDEVAFEFSMFCEVGRLWQPMFAPFMARNDVATVELSSRPWLADVLKS